VKPAEEVLLISVFYTSVRQRDSRAAMRWLFLVEERLMMLRFCLWCRPRGNELLVPDRSKISVPSSNEQRQSSGLSPGWTTTMDGGFDVSPAPDRG